MTHTLPGADIRHYYAALGIELPTWASENASVHCFIDPNAHHHGDRHASCSVDLTTGAFNCHGCGARGGAYDAAIQLGHNPESAIELMIRFRLVERRHGSTKRHRRARRISGPQPSVKPGSAPAFDVSEDEVAHWRTSLGLRPLLLQRLASERLWSAKTIRTFELGIDGDRITIPVRDDRGHLVGLLRYRAWGANRPAKMLAAAGSQRRLLPHPVAESSQQLILVEGEPDMLAARSHELPAIALPGVEAWRAEWADQFAGRHVAIVMDADHQGRAAARRIADDLAPQANTTIFDIGPERDDGYDLTDWILDGQANPGGLDFNCLLDARRAHGR
jgi:DNA primase